MIPETKHLCECGREAVVQLDKSKGWRCVFCLINDMWARGIGDVLLVPCDDGEVDVLAPLVDAVALRLCRN